MDDKEVIVSCQQGRTKHYALLIERYQRLAYSISYRILGSREDAEDITQEAFIRVYGRIQATSDIEFLPYLKTTITHLCYDRMRRQKTINKHLELAIKDELLDFRSPELEFMHSSRQAMLRQALQELPAMYSEVLTLHYVAERTYEQIAELLGQPMSIVKNRIFRGKKLLRDIYLRLEGGVAIEV